MRQFLGWAAQTEPVSAGYGGVAPMAAGAPSVGQLIGNQLGGWLSRPHYGSMISDQPPNWGVLPFQAGPGGYGAIAPMGAGGQAAGQWAGNQVGNLVGGWLGNSGLGGQIGSWGGGVLGSLLPFQAGPPTGAPIGGLGGAAVSPFGAAAGPTTVDPEAQAVNALTKIATSCTIQKLYDYLTANSATSNRLGEVIPVVKQATDAYGQGNYGQSFIAVYQAILAIEVLRTQVADLPPL
jgi:hypothetical protein